MESSLYSEFRWEAEHGGKLPVAIPCSDGVYLRSYRAASWSAVYSEDEDARLACILTCMIYTHNEADSWEGHEPEPPDSIEA